MKAFISGGLFGVFWVSVILGAGALPILVRPLLNTPLGIAGVAVAVVFLVTGACAWAMENNK